MRTVSMPRTRGVVPSGGAGQGWSAGLNAIDETDRSSHGPSRSHPGFRGPAALAAGEQFESVASSFVRAVTTFFNNDFGHG